MVKRLNTHGRVGCYITKRSVAAGRGRYARSGAAEPSYTTVRRRERPRENGRVTRYYRPVTHTCTRPFSAIKPTAFSWKRVFGTVTTEFGTYYVDTAHGDIRSFVSADVPGTRSVFLDKYVFIAVIIGGVIWEEGEGWTFAPREKIWKVNAPLIFSMNCFFFLCINIIRVLFPFLINLVW